MASSQQTAGLLALLFPIRCRTAGVALSCQLNERETTWTGVAVQGVYFPIYFNCPLSQRERRMGSDSINSIVFQNSYKLQYKLNDCQGETARDQSLTFSFTESGTITARAKTSTNKHESDEDSAVSWSSGTGTEFPSLSSIFETYVKPVLNENSIESVKRLAEEFKNWFRDVRKSMTKMAEELYDDDGLAKAEVYSGRQTIIARFYGKYKPLIQDHYHQLMALEERKTNQFWGFDEGDNTSHSTTDLTADEDAAKPSRADNQSLTRLNVLSHNKAAIDNTKSAVNVVKPPPPVGVNTSTTTETRTPVRTGRDRITPGPQHELQLDTERTYPLSSWVLENYVKPILLEDSIELIKDLLGKFANWYEEEPIYYNELIEECCEREELDKVESFNGQITALNSSFREQLHLIRMHCQQLDDWADEQSDEESPETSNEGETAITRARTSTDRHDIDEDTTNSWSSETGTEFPSSSSIFKTYVEPVLKERLAEKADRLAKKFESWFREATKSVKKLVEQCYNKDNFKKADAYFRRQAKVAKFHQEQQQLIQYHYDQLMSLEERRTGQICGAFDEVNEESSETSNYTFLPRTNVASDEADSYSLNGLTEDDGGVQPPELNDGPFLNRSDIESSDENEDDDMTDMSSLISDIKRRIEELRNSLDVDETDSDSQNDLTESEVEDEWFQVVGNSSPMDSESHDIETAVTSYTNGQNSRHPIETTEVFSESVQTSNNNETCESNKTVPDISAELSKGLMFGLDLHKKGLFKSDNSWNDGNNENLRNDLSFKTLWIMN